MARICEFTALFSIFNSVTHLLHLEFYKIALIKKSLDVWINIWITPHVIIMRAFPDLNLLIFLMNHTFYTQLLLTIVSCTTRGGYGKSDGKSVFDQISESMEIENI